jgi:hypothetical protein
MYALVVRGVVISHVRVMASFLRPRASRRQPKKDCNEVSLAIAAAAMSSPLSAEDEDVCEIIKNVQARLYKSIN